VRSGAKTGRSPKDKRVVDEPTTSADVNWGEQMNMNEIRNYSGQSERRLQMRALSSRFEPIPFELIYLVCSFFFLSGSVNIKLTAEAFASNRERAISYLNTRQRIYVVDGYAGWDKKCQKKVRVICERPYHALFMVC
jgi:ATP-dependent phosphoenolpyruvate carboxykinase